MASDNKPRRLDGMSGAGLLVVGALCLALVLVVLTACALAIYQAIAHPGVVADLPPALDRLLQGLVVAVPALLAKTYTDTKRSSDPGQEDPTTVTAAAGSTVQVTPGSSDAPVSDDPPDAM